MELRWDGSDLGVINPPYYIFDHDNCKYGYFVDFSTWVIICKYNSSFICIVDELKSIFKINKTGTHRAVWLGKTWVISRVYCLEGRPLQLSNINLLRDEFIDKNLIFDVQKIIVFRDILSIKRNIGKHIKILPYKRLEFSDDGNPGKLKFELISVNEKNSHYNEGRKNMFTEKFYERWFENINSQQILMKIFFGSTISGFSTDPGYSNKIEYILNDVQDNIERIIKRVDASMIWLVSSILEKLTIRLITKN